MLLTYIGTVDATVTYSLDNADKTEAVAATGTGVTALKVGTNNTVYGVTVADPPGGGAVHWYEGGDYQASESIPTLPDNAGIAAAKAAAESADGKLTSERLARVDTLDAATGTLTLSFRLLLDSDGDGIADVPAVGVGGVTCHLLAHGTHTRIRESATTDSQGYVYWHGLAAGTYDVDPDAAGYEGVTVAVTIPEV